MSLYICTSYYNGLLKNFLVLAMTTTLKNWIVAHNVITVPDPRPIPAKLALIWFSDLNSIQKISSLPNIFTQNVEFNFQWDDDEISFVLDQHAELDLHSASSRKQQSADRYVATLGHNYSALSHPIFALTMLNNWSFKKISVFIIDIYMEWRVIWYLSYNRGVSQIDIPAVLDVHIYRDILLLGFGPYRWQW
jgi:hypothetical protein